MKKLTGFILMFPFIILFFNALIHDTTIRYIIIQICINGLYVIALGLFLYGLYLIFPRTIDFFLNTIFNLDFHKRKSS
jgi:hypothetical protein